MTGAKLSHEEVSLILPWYLNGTLDNHELDTVKRHLSECALCTREIAELNFIGSVITESNEALSRTLDMRFEDMERNMMDRIDTFEDARAADKRPGAVPARTSAWSSVLEFLEGFKFPFQIPVGVAALIILQLALIIGLASKLYLGEPEGYVVLSGPGETAANGPVIILSFVDTATEGQIRGALDEIDGRIIDGPKAGGLYVVELTGGPFSDEAVDQIIGKLKTEKDIIKSVFKGQRGK